MRTVTYKSVLDGIVRRHGMNPKDPAIPSDTFDAITEHANKRLADAESFWEWPQLTVTEERAFRTIWSVSKQFRVAGENGKPDELIYLPTLIAGDPPYFKVKADAPGDPPPGTLPTNTTYFEALDPVDKYVSLDQWCRRPIGEVLGVYSGNPRVRCPRPLHFRPSEKGIDVRGCSSWTVWLRYMIPAEVFSYDPYIPGASYTRGQVRYYAPTGEAYQCRQDHTVIHLPTDTDYWRPCQFPAFLAEHVKAAVYADGLKETDPNASADEMIARLRLAQAAEDEAQGHLVKEINSLQAQGQRFTYRRLLNRAVIARPWNWLISPCWCDCWCNGSSEVTSLTDVCDPDGFEPPVPATEVTCDTSYHSEIVAILTADGTPSLEGLSTTVRQITCTKISIVIDVGGTPESQEWRLDAGAADPGDDGQVAPADYDAGTNNKHWVKVG